MALAFGSDGVSLSVAPLWRGRRANNTVPTTAMTSSTDVSSNAKTWLLNRSLASWRMFESWPELLVSEQRLSALHDGGADESEQTDPDDRGEWALHLDRVNAERFGLVNSQQHDHE